MKIKLGIPSFFILVLSVAADNGSIRLPDQQEKYSPESNGEESRNGRNLLQFVNYLTSGQKQDPLVVKIQNNCYNGDLSECFRSQALNSLDDFFSDEDQRVSSSVKIVTLPQTQLRVIDNQPLEYVEEARSSDSTWEELQKFLLRKVERYVKSHGFEIDIPNELLDESHVKPRFINEIDDEMDILEDKKAPLYVKHRLKKMFIPMLLILKLFKLKLILFLPLLLGVAGLKKLLGFAAFVLPGVIGYLKYCRPNPIGGGFFNKNNVPPHYDPQGLGIGYNNHAQASSFASSDSTIPYFSKTNDFNNGYNVRFNQEDSYQQNLAYKGYPEYRNQNHSNDTESTQ